MEKNTVLEEVVETKEDGFIKKHAKGIKRGLAVVGGLVGVVVAGAIINNKANSDEEFVGYGNDPYGSPEETSTED